MALPNDNESYAAVISFQESRDSTLEESFVVRTRGFINIYFGEHILQFCRFRSGNSRQ
jgi:hypothetical protein